MISKSHFVGEHIANINQYYNFIQRTRPWVLWSCYSCAEYINGAYLRL